MTASTPALDPFESVSAGVIVIDTEYGRPRMDASYLLVDEGHAAYVDTGTALSVPNLLAALDAQDLDVEAVETIFLTHVHLDHAGGVGLLAAALPRARVLVHPRGLPHVVDPTILAAATQAVYGEEAFATRYGTVYPVAAERVAAVEDGQRVRLGRRTFDLIHTPGHALHHLCLIDRDTGEAFTGDTFGVSYRELDTAAGAFIFPTTSPSQFDPAQLHASIDRLLAYRPSCAYLTHYGRVSGLDALGRDLHTDIDAFVRIAGGMAGGPDRARLMEPLLFAHLSARLDALGCDQDDTRRHAVLDGDIGLNAAGLDLWLARRRT